MEIDDLNIILLELKYCERCGRLWLRPRGSEEGLCAPALLEERNSLELSENIICGWRSGPRSEWMAKAGRSW